MRFQTKLILAFFVACTFGGLVFTAIYYASTEARKRYDAEAAASLEGGNGDLSALRLSGALIGFTGYSLLLFAAWKFAKSLSVPINELTAGTRNIREGNLDSALPVRSNDELGKLTESFNQMTSELRQKERYRELLEKVSDETVARAMIEGRLDLKLGGELKEVSILFCDIRGFTRLTETMRPEAVIEMLNEHMSALAAPVGEHGGVVDKFIGDEIMAVFGSLKDVGNHAESAARCALAMVDERQRLNGLGGHAIEIGIGIATGEVVAGCMGSKDRLNYTVVGSTVNLAANLCARARPGEILIDAASLDDLAAFAPEFEERSNLQLKGSAPQRTMAVLRSLGGMR